MRPFRVEVPDAALDDLRAGLRGTRWPEAETVADWSQGVPLAYLRELCGYWAEGYDWRATEARINALPSPSTWVRNCGRVLDLPAREPAPVAALGGAALHRDPLLERASARRPLRGLRAARAVRRRDPSVRAAGAMRARTARRVVPGTMTR